MKLTEHSKPIRFSFHNFNPLWSINIGNIINVKSYYNIIYSAEPLSLLTDELEEAVWKEYYLKFIESNIKNIGISSTACYILWQVFNRMADEQYYPPAVPKVDHQKILVKCAKVCFITIRDRQTE